MIKKNKNNPMIWFFQLLEFISLVYAALSGYLPNQNHTYNDQIGIIDSPTCDEIHKIRDKQTLVRKKLLSKIFTEKDINMRINILEIEYYEYMHVSTKDLKDSICWNNVFTDEIEEEIRLESLYNKRKDDFGIRLEFIIEELYANICMCYTAGAQNCFYSIEMINKLNFLKEIYSEYYKEFEYEIVELVTELLLVHFLEAIVFSAERIEEVILMIEKHDKELKKLILPKSVSLVILNDIIEGMPNHCLPCINLYFELDSENFADRNIIDCHESVRGENRGRFITREQPYFLTIRYNAYINMEYIYETLEELKLRWESHKYTSFECSHILYLYIIEFILENSNKSCKIIHNLDDYQEYIRCYSIIQSKNNFRLSSFLTELLPDKFADVLDKWYFGDRSHLLMTCYRTFIKIVDYRKHLLDEDTKDLFIALSALKSEEGIRCIKAVLYCYDAYKNYMNHKFKDTSRKIRYDLESYDDIINIILCHLNTMDPTAFRNDLVNYVLLCMALKNLTSATIEYSDINNSKFFSDYPHLLRFYKEYHRTCLRIDSIYNICFILGKALDGSVLKLYPDVYSDNKINDFINTANMFVEHLRTIQNEQLTYDEQTNDTLSHLISCIIGIKQGNLENTLIMRGLEYKSNFIVSSVTSHSAIQLYLNFIELNFWEKKSINFRNANNEKKVVIYSIHDLYADKYILETDIRRLYNVCCTLLSLNSKHDMNILEIGAINRENKRKKEEILSDIMLYAFKKIEDSKQSNNYTFESHIIAKFLYKSYKLTCNKNIVRKIFSELNLTRIFAARDEMSRVIGVIGSYELFDDRIKSYLIVVRSKNIVKNILNTSKNNSAIRGYVYESLLKYCNFLNYNIKEIIRNTNSSIIHDLCKQLTIILSIIETVEDDFVISAELFKFISRTISIADNYAQYDILLTLAKIVDTLNDVMIGRFAGYNLLADTLAHCKIMFFMVKLIFFNHGRLANKILTDFIDLCCSATIEISKSCNFPIIEILKACRYKKLRDDFLEIISDFDNCSKWEILSSLIYYRTNDIMKYKNSQDFSKFILIMSNAFKHDKDGKTAYSKFITVSYCILERFLIAIEDNCADLSTLDAHSILEICIHLNRDKHLLGSLAHRIVTELIESKKCHICLCEIRGQSPCKIVEFKL